MREPRISSLSSILTINGLGSGRALSACPLFAEDFDWRNVNGQNWVTSVKRPSSAGPAGTSRRAASWKRSTC